MAEKVITLVDVYNNIDKIKEHIFTASINSNWEDADDMTTPGVWQIGENFSSIPDIESGVLIVIKDSKTLAIHQLYFSISNKVWYRNDGKEHSFGDTYWSKLTQE